MFQVNIVVVNPFLVLCPLSSSQERTGKSVLQAVDHMDDGTPINLTVSIDENKVNHFKTSRYSLSKEVQDSPTRAWLQSCLWSNFNKIIYVCPVTVAPSPLQRHQQHQSLSIFKFSYIRENKLISGLIFSDRKRAQQIANSKYQSYLATGPCRKKRSSTTFDHC